jgi:Integrase core domain
MRYHSCPTRAHKGLPNLSAVTIPTIKSEHICAIVCQRRPRRSVTRLVAKTHTLAHQVLSCHRAYSKVACAKLYTTKTPITAADLLNDKVLPLFEEHGLPMLRILTDRGTEYCGRPERHDYQLYLAVNDIEHAKTKVKSPQTNGICERFHRTVLQEFYQVVFRKRVFETIDQLQKELDTWLEFYNTERTHQGKMCCGRTPLETLIDGKTAWAEKRLS